MSIDSEEFAIQSTVFELFDLPMTIDHEASAHDIAT